MDHELVIEKLKQHLHCGEVYHVSHLRCWRTRSDGELQQVDIEILDAGPNSDRRYQCSATGGDGRFATGNPDNNLEALLATVHWFELDRG